MPVPARWSRCQDALHLQEAPLRIECYDISNLQGTEIVASMVVMEDGLPKRSDYRRFKIRHQPGQDDFASMEEVLTRRFRRYLQDRDEGARSGKRFAYPPNLVLIDGGKGQLGVAVRVLEEMGLEDIAVASLAKRFEEVYLPGDSEPVRIPRDSEALYLLQQVRDEAHRFAITYHRQLRDKKMTRSVLDDVAGLGPVREPRLLKEHGSVKRLRALAEDELVAIPWLPEPVARARCTPTCTASGVARVTLDVTIITGMSGAGRSAAADVLEDLGFFVIDNLPPSLVTKVAELGRGTEGLQQFGLVIDVRSGEFVDDLVAALASCARRGRAPGCCSSTPPTTCSCAGTRRAVGSIPSPPASGCPEGSPTSGSCSKTSRVVPTSCSTPASSTCTSCASGCASSSMPITRPARSRRASCRSATSTVSPSTSTWCSTAASFPTRTGSTSCVHAPGTDPSVRDYVLAQPEAGPFLEELERLFALLLPAYVREGKSYLSIGIGCTGGRHRSVVIATELARLLEPLGVSPRVHHRDVERG